MPNISNIFFFNMHQQILSQQAFYLSKVIIHSEKNALLTMNTTREKEVKTRGALFHSGKYGSSLYS